MIYEAPVLRHFTARFEELGARARDGWEYEGRSRVERVSHRTLGMTTKYKEVEDEADGKPPFPGCAHGCVVLRVGCS